MSLSAQEEQFVKAQQLAYSGQHAEAEAALGQLAASYPDYLPAALLADKAVIFSS